MTYYCHMLFMPPLHNSSCLQAVPDSSTKIASKCEIALWAKQDLWNHDTLLHSHRATTKKSTSLWLSPTLTPPASSSYKTMEPGAACGGLLSLTWGDFVVSLTITTIHGVSISTGLCRLPLRNRQAWLLLRNPWRWCPSSRGNAWVTICSAV